MTGTLWDTGLSHKAWFEINVLVRVEACTLSGFFVDTSLFPCRWRYITMNLKLRKTAFLRAPPPFSYYYAQCGEARSFAFMYLWLKQASHSLQLMKQTTRDNSKFASHLTQASQKKKPSLRLTQLLLLTLLPWLKCFFADFHEAPDKKYLTTKPKIWNSRSPHKRPVPASRIWVQLVDPSTYDVCLLYVRVWRMGLTRRMSEWVPSWSFLYEYIRTGLYVQ
jgi:hypothetical protein